jgi:hypothetical protein
VQPKQFGLMKTQACGRSNQPMLQNDYQIFCAIGNGE